MLQAVRHQQHQVPLVFVCDVQRYLQVSELHECLIKWIMNYELFLYGNRWVKALPNKLNFCFLVEFWNCTGWTIVKWTSAHESFLSRVSAKRMRITPSAGHWKHHHIPVFSSHWLQQETISSVCLCFCFGGVFVLMPKRDRKTKCAFLCCYGHM